MGNLDRQEPETGFWLRHRPQRVCAFAKASPIPKNPRFAAPHYFFNALMICMKLTHLHLTGRVLPGYKRAYSIEVYE